MLTKEVKTELVRKYASEPKDTGSSAVQVALLSKRIELITEHLKSHKYDHSTRRGLLKLVGQRKSLMRYMQHSDTAAYKKVCSELGLR